MKFKEILRKGHCILVDREEAKEYIVGVNYDPEAPEGQKWGYGMYFPYRMDADLKAKALADAVDYLLIKTDETYISRARLEEISTKALNEVKEGTEDYMDEFLDELDLTEFEKGFFGFDNIEDDEEIE